MCRMNGTSAQSRIIPDETKGTIFVNGKWDVLPLGMTASYIFLPPSTSGTVRTILIKSPNTSWAFTNSIGEFVVRVVLANGSNSNGRTEK